LLNLQPAEYIADPEAKKPEDYVEAEEIADPEAKQPEDWDAEEDGEWEAPKIKNPHGNALRLLPVRRLCNTVFTITITISSNGTS
jgi:hypothetical protein